MPKKHLLMLLQQEHVQEHALCCGVAMCYVVMLLLTALRLTGPQGKHRI
jgi:hypothetical protein